MKKLLFLVLLLSQFLGYAQYTLIPDVNFEKALISLGIDSGVPDGRVLRANVSGINSLNVVFRNIIDLTGIEDFSSLTFLSCEANKLSSLNVSKNLALNTLYCYANQITELDISKNTALTGLGCSSNQITSLDLSKNIKLVALYCSNNKLQTLNLKNGNNTNFATGLSYLTSNPNLTCIQVDNKAYSDTNWSAIKDATAIYSDDCGYTAAAPLTPLKITATGNQTYCPGTSLNIVEKVNIAFDPSDPNTDEVSIQIASGYVFGQDLLTLTGSHPTISFDWIPSEGKLKLYSTTGFNIPYADFEAAIANVKFSNSSPLTTGTRTFSINLGSSQISYLPRNKHFYEFVANIGITWTDAKIAAETSTYYGLQGYLATLTAPDEAQLAGTQVPGAGWIGGSDQETEGVWKWVTGPEVGTIFWNGLVNGSSPNYANWNNNEPNQFNAGEEDFAHVTAPNIGIPGSWNDLTITGDLNGNYQPKGYIVEYGGMIAGDVDPIQISASTSMTIPQITVTTPAPICGSGTVTL